MEEEGNVHCHYLPNYRVAHCIMQEHVSLVIQLALQHMELHSLNSF